MTAAWAAYARWWLAPAPPARVAVLRAVLYLFVVVDVLVWVNDVVPHGYAPQFYQPLLVLRLVGHPAPTPEYLSALQVVLLVAAVVAASGRLPRLAGWTVAVCFLEWLLMGMSYSKVDHDHFALLVALWVLPTVGAAGWRDRRPSVAAGWALRCIQVATVATYFASFFSKWVRSGTPMRWAGSAVFTWAITRRGTELGRLLLDYPGLLRVGQWGLLAMELASPVVLFLRGRALALGAAAFLGFHLVTYLMIGIHFLPTVVCWLAFAPLERLVPTGRRVATTAPRPAPAPAAR